MPMKCMMLYKRVACRKLGFRHNIKKGWPLPSGLSLSVGRVHLLVLGGEAVATGQGCGLASTVTC